MQVKILMTIEVDVEEYPMPVDGYVSNDVKEFLFEYFYDIDGMEIRKINVTQGE